MIIGRRGFLAGFLASPAICKAGSLMKISTVKVPSVTADPYGLGGRPLREIMRCAHARYHGAHQWGECGGREVVLQLDDGNVVSYVKWDGTASWVRGKLDERRYEAGSKSDHLHYGKMTPLVESGELALWPQVIAATEARERVAGSPAIKIYGNPEPHNPFYVAPETVPAGWVYEWKRRSVFGRPDIAHQARIRKTWRPVPLSRHPEMLSASLDGEITRNGMVLMERSEDEVRGVQEKEYQAAAFFWRNRSSA